MDFGGFLIFLVILIPIIWIFSTWSNINASSEVKDLQKEIEVYNIENVGKPYRALGMVSGQHSYKDLTLRTLQPLQFHKRHLISLD